MPPAKTEYVIFRLNANFISVIAKIFTNIFKTRVECYYTQYLQVSKRRILIKKIYILKNLKELKKTLCH